jgi:hypothetical protein
MENYSKYLLLIFVISTSLFLIIDFLAEAMKSYKAENKGKAKSLIIQSIILLLTIAIILINAIIPRWGHSVVQIALLGVPIPLIYLLERVKQALQAGNGGKTLIAGVITLLLLLTISVWALEDLEGFSLLPISVWDLVVFFLIYGWQIIITIIFLYLIWDFLREVSNFSSTMKIKKTKDRIFAKLDVKIILALIFVGRSLWLLNTPPQTGIDPWCEICHRLTRLEYREMKKGINGLITGEDVDIQSLESLLFPKDDTDREMLCVSNFNRVGNESIYHCNSCMETLYHFLHTAYRSIQNNEKTAARIALWRGDIYLIFHPFCFNCDCNKVPVLPWDGTVYFPCLSMV